MRSPDPPQLRLLGLAGSLRRDSLNRRLVKALAARARAGARLDIADQLADVPLFNEDLEADGGPIAVARLRDAVRDADGLVIATPEYNQSVPGVTKNLIDWLSRGEPSVLEHKPVALMGASVGPWGTRLAQAALRQTLTACGAFVMPAPQLYLRSAGDAFDPSGFPVDPKLGDQLDALLAAFCAWVGMVRAARTKERRA